MQVIYMNSLCHKSQLEIKKRTCDTHKKFETSIKSRFSIEQLTLNLIKKLG